MSPLRILVVAPERHAREGLHAMLCSDGHEVSVAEDMWSAFARISSGRFDVLLLDDDVRPERHLVVSVLDLLRFARRYQPATAGIVISSFAEGVSHCVAETGVRAVLAKPVEVGRLRVELEALKSGQSRRSVT